MPKLPSGWGKERRRAGYRLTFGITDVRRAKLVPLRRPFVLSDQFRERVCDGRTRSRSDFGACGSAQGHLCCDWPSKPEKYGTENFPAAHLAQ